MTYHVKIAVDRRSEERKSPFTDTGTIHCLGDRIDSLEDENILMVVEWDQLSPYVICHKGDYSATDLRFAGWPEITKEEYDALPAPDPLA